MQESTGYGKRLGEALRSGAATFVPRSLQTGDFAVTEFRPDNPAHGVSAQLVREDAFLIGHQLTDYPVHEYFEEGREACRILVEPVRMAAGIHLAKTYGGVKLAPRPLRGGLAPWQIKRAEEKLVANLEGNVSLAELATHCRVSVGHFARAFRRSKGLSPHQWLLRRRVDEARHLMRNRTLSLSEVALACGFVDQSHFTRVFTRLIGISPGAWRRNLA